MPHTVAILGTGLIGASLGLALGTADPETAPLGRCRVIGYDGSSQQLRIARGRLAIDDEAKTAADAVKEADIVVLATPVQTLPALMREIAPHLRYKALVTDVCSTKTSVLQWAKEFLPSTVSFVGGHPMAGREKVGAEAAELDLFKGAVYCLCPPVNATPEATDLATAFVETIGAKPYYIDPEEHDIYVAGISHLPFLLAAAQTEVVTRSPSWREMQMIAASGFRDLTRLASGDPVMHRDICSTNRSAIKHWVNESIRVLVEMRTALEDDKMDDLQHMFEHAKIMRDQWLTLPQNQRPGEGDQLADAEIGTSISQRLFGNPAALLRGGKKK